MASNNKNKGIIVFLLLTVIVIGFLAYQNSRDYTKLQIAFQEEKNELESELNKIITDYDRAITNKIEMSSSLRKQQIEIINLRDSIKNLKEKNYNLLRIYRKRIYSLEKQNKKLFAQVDSLSEINSFLKVENDSVKEELNEKSILSNRLAKKNKFLRSSKNNLEKTVKKVQVLEVDNFQAEAMKKRNSGKYTDTSRSSKTEAFKVSMNVLKNEFANAGQRKIYIQVIDEDKNIIAAEGHITLKNGQKMVYTDVFTVDYNNNEISLVTLIKVPKKRIQKGKYSINAYLEGELVANQLVTLR